MSFDKEEPNESRPNLRLAKAKEGMGAEEKPEDRSKLPRQFVNFTFYRARPEWYSTEDKERDLRKQAFLNTFEEYRTNLIMHTYSLVGLRINADFMIWRIGYD